MFRKIKKHYNLVTVFLIVLFLFLTMPQVTKPVLVDELFWIEAAKGVNERGLPVVGYMKENGDAFLIPFSPPLLTYTVAFLLASGFPENMIRLMPLFFRILTILLVYLIAKRVRNDKGFIVLSLLLFIISPFGIQSSLLLDDDTSMLTFFMTSFIYLFLRFYSKLDAKRCLVLGFVFSISMLTKPVTPIFMILIVFVFYIIKKDMKGFLKSVLIGVSGGGFYVLEWFFYASQVGVPYFGFLEYSSHVIPIMGVFEYFVIRILYAGLKIHIFWFTLAFIVLALFALKDRISYQIKNHEIGPIDFLWMYSVFLFIIHIVFGQSPWRFPTYVVPTLPVFSILVAEFLIRQQYKLDKKRLLYYFIVFLIPMVFYALFLPDPLMTPHSFEEALNISVLYAIPLIISFLFLLSAERKRIPYTVIITCIIVFFSTSIYTNYIHLTANYSTIYNYGEGGFLEAVDYLETHSSPKDIIIAPADIAYNAERRFYEIDDDLDSENCQTVLKERRIRFAVLRGDWDNKYNPTLFRCLKDNYKETNFGNFYIYDII